MVKYGSVIKKDEYGIVFRLKKIFGFVELRICEYWSECASKEDELHSALNLLIKEVRPLFVTLSADTNHKKKSRKKNGSTLGPFKIGPVVTLKAVSTNLILKLSHFKTWRPSIGTMELF